MNTDTLTQQWKAYLEIYADIPNNDRKRLLEQSVSANVVSTNPEGEIQESDSLLEHIEQFQKKLPERT